MNDACSHSSLLVPPSTISYNSGNILMIIQEKLTRKTYFEYGVGKLEALCHAAGMTAKTPQILEMFQSLTSHWSNKIIENYPLWLSDIADDYTPFEFSVAFEGNQPELRILFEAQG